MIRTSNQQDSFVIQMMDMLQGPIITWNAMNADAIPPRLKREIPIQRLISGMKRETMATFPEVTAYLITRTLDGPLDSDWTEIYCFASCTTCEMCWNEDHWENTSTSKKLTQWQNDLLYTLRKKIYAKRLEYASKQYRLSNQKSRLKATELVIENL